jgi:tetratricopeptide (TPR) repeat protein
MSRPETTKFEVLVAKAALWIRDHQERFWAVTGTTALTILLIFFMVHHRQQRNEEAWNQLGLVQNQLMQNQMADAKKTLADWQTKFQGTSASGYAKFMEADLLYRTSDYTNAAQLYGSLADGAPKKDMRPLALTAQASAQEMAGQLPQAQATVQRFLNEYGDHFLAAPNHLAQARLAELTGDKAAASAAYDRFIALYPQHPSVPLARARLQSLPANQAKPQ